MPKILDRIMDAIDFETFLVCESDEEGRKLVVQLIKEWGFNIRVRAQELGLGHTSTAQETYMAG